MGNVTRRLDSVSAVVDRKVTPAPFEMDRIMDETIRAQLPKVKVTADPEIEAAFPALQKVAVTIQTTSRAPGCPLGQGTSWSSA